MPNHFPIARRSLALALSACGLLALLLQGCAYRGSALPLPPEEAAVPDTLRKEPVVMLSDSTFYRLLHKAGRNLLERRNVTWYRVNRRSPALLENLGFHDDEITQETAVIRVDAYYPDGRRWSADGDRLDRIRPKAYGLHVEMNGFYREAKVPRYGEGLILRVEITALIVRPEFWSREPLRCEYACLRRHISLQVPAGHGFRIGLRNGENLPVKVDTAAVGNDLVITATASDVPKTIPARSPRYPEEWYAGMHFSIPPRGLRSFTWAEIGDHYLAMMQGSIAPGPALKAAAAGLGTGDAEAVTERAFNLVKSKVRYLADSRGLNAWVPRAPESVWANGYGDCKEMSNLMRGLLAEKGVEAGIALVRTVGGPQLHGDFPALDQFNHAILYRRRKDGTVAFLDPTMPVETGLSSYLPLLAQKTLLIEPGATRVDTVRPMPGYRNRVTTASRLFQGKGGSWELKGVIGLKGKAAMDLWLELRFRNQNPEEARARVSAFLSGRFGIQPSEFSWKQPAADSLEISYAQPADAMSLAAAGQGVKLDLPWLFENGRGEEDQDGERHIPAFEQQDAWILPEGFGKLRKSDLTGDRVTGVWTLSGTEARRALAVSGAGWKAGEIQERRNFRETLERFAVATVWR